MDAVNQTRGNDNGQPAPLAFTSRKFGTFDEYVVPSNVYSKVRFGRERNERWNTFVEHPDLSDQLKTSLYKDGRCYVTCDQTGASVVLKHQKIARNAVNESVSDIVPQIALVEAEIDVGEDDDYLDAYDYALVSLAFTEDQADFFAQCVLSFLDEYNTSDFEIDSEIDLESVLLFCVNEVRTVSVEQGLDPHNELDVFQRLAEYINTNYSLE